MYIFARHTPHRFLTPRREVAKKFCICLPQSPRRTQRIWRGDWPGARTSPPGECHPSGRTLTLQLIGKPTLQPEIFR